MSGGNFSTCYPFQRGQDTTNYEYKDNATEKKLKYIAHPNVQFFSQEEVRGKTFEYDLVLHNPTLEFLVTESMSNQAEIKDLMCSFKDNQSVEELLDKLPEGTKENPNKKNIEIKRGIRECNWDNDNDKRAAIIASRYLNSVVKGENALELAYALENNLKQRGQADYQDFVVPAYIEDALGWICQ